LVDSAIFEIGVSDTNANFGIATRLTGARTTSQLTMVRRTARSAVNSCVSLIFTVIGIVVR
jgi:hypothetical protein